MKWLPVKLTLLVREWEHVEVKHGSKDISSQYKNIELAFNAYLEKAGIAKNRVYAKYPGYAFNWLVEYKGWIIRAYLREALPGVDGKFGWKFVKSGS